MFFLNFLGEKRETESEAAIRLETLCYRNMALGILVGVAAVTMLVVGLTTRNVDVNFALGCVVLVVVVGSLLRFLRPFKVAKVAAFKMLESALAISIEGATFYFFTDGPEAFPGGPNFSPWFYSSGIGMLNDTVTIIGILAAYRWGRNLRYHSLIYIPNVMWICLGLTSLLVYTRYNLVLGIPDVSFMIVSTILRSIVTNWMFVPSFMIITQCCPPGQEASLFALLAGASNLGSALGDVFGSFLLARLGVRPHGGPGDAEQFKNLWIAALVQALLPLITLALVPWMIPNVLPTERILTAQEEAEASSQPQRRSLVDGDAAAGSRA